MNNAEAFEALKALRFTVDNSFSPNLKHAIKYQAPIAALVYGLALIDTMAGFFYGIEAKKQAKRGDGVGIRYDRFIAEYLAPACSGCDYSQLDFYKSMRCNMAHSLTPGHSQNGKFDFELRQDAASIHGTSKTTRTIVFDVPTFCNDVLQATVRFLGDVELSFNQSPEPLILQSFKGWWNDGYSILV